MIYPHSFHGVHRDDKLRYLVSYLCVFVGSGRRIKVFLSFLDIIFKLIFQIVILSSLPPLLCFLLPRASCGIWSLNQSCLETLHLNPKLTWIREFTVNEAPDFFSGINLVACVYDAVWTQASLSAKFFFTKRFECATALNDKGRIGGNHEHFLTQFQENWSTRGFGNKYQV